MVLRLAALAALLWVASLPAQVKDRTRPGGEIESQIVKALNKSVRCKKIQVQATYSAERPTELERLAIKMDEIEIQQLIADHMTVVYEKPVINTNKLKKDQQLEFISSSKTKVSILASAKSLEQYLMRKAAQFNKKNVRISLKFSPPYIECLYDVPANEIASESVELLKTFIRGGKVEGYAAFKIEVKENALYAFSSKVITNHFLIPNPILNLFQSKFNPFDQIQVVKPFQYTLSNLTVQSKYMFMTN